IMIAPAVANAVQAPEPRPELIPHLDAIAALARSSPMVPVPEGWFLMGTNLKHGDPSGMATQFDDTEQPQRRIWLDAFEIDRDEVSLSEYLAFLKVQGQLPSEELQGLIWHLITVHFMPDYVPARWPALYVSWSEAAEFCQTRGKRLPRPSGKKPHEVATAISFPGAAKNPCRDSRCSGSITPTRFRWLRPW